MTYPNYLQEKYHPVFDSIVEEIGRKYKNNLSGYVAGMARYKTMVDDICYKMNTDSDSVSEEDISRLKRCQKLYNSLANLVGAQKLDLSSLQVDRL